MPERPQHDPEGSRNDPPLSAMDRKITDSRTATRLLLLAGGVTLLVAVGAYVPGALERHQTASLSQDRISMSTARTAPFVERIPLSGRIVPRTSVFIDVVDGGQVTAVYVEAGAMVTEGQALLEMKNTLLQLDVIGREAQLTEQINDLSATHLAFEQDRLLHVREIIEIDHAIGVASRGLARLEPLLSRGSAAQAEYADLEAELAYRRELKAAILEAQTVDEDFRRTQIDSLQKAITAMTRNLSIARENLANLVIVAPIAGQLSLLDAHVGETRTPGQRIGRIDELDAFKVAARIDEFYLPRVSRGQRASVEIAGAKHVLELTKVYPDVRDGGFEVELSFVGEAPEGIRHGQTVRPRLTIASDSDALMVQSGPFYADTGGTWAFVVDADGESAERRAVRFGRTNGDGIEVLEGLGEGERILTSSYREFLEAERIEIAGQPR